MTNKNDFTILILTSSYPSSSDVIVRTFMTDLVESLSNKEISIIIVCPHQKDLPYREIQKKNTIIRFPYWFTSSGELLGGPGGMISSIKHSFFSMFQLIPFLICEFFWVFHVTKKENIDIIHSHWIIPQGLVGALVSAITGIPHVTSIHGTDIHLIHSHRILYPVIRMISKYSHCITTNSSHTLRLLHNVVQTRGKSRIIPMGIDPNEFLQSKEIPRSLEKTVLFVGRLINWKGVSVLIQAMKIVETRLRGSKLVVIGDGPDRHELEEEVVRLGLSPIVYFMGKLDRENLLTWYRSAEVFVLPSITYKNQTEGLGVVLLEAMAACVPVIGSNTGGIPDIIEDGVNGLLVPPSDPDALADAIIRIFENPDLADRFREAGQKSVQESFSWDKISDEFIEVYQGVLHESNEV